MFRVIESRIFLIDRMSLFSQYMSPIQVKSLVVYQQTMWQMASDFDTVMNTKREVLDKINSLGTTTLQREIQILLSKDPWNKN